MPVLHPMMTGGSGFHHQIDWCIADHEAGYLAPAKTLAAMAVDLLSGGGEEAARVLSQHHPAMAKEEYLDYQRSIFQTELYDGATG